MKHRHTPQYLRSEQRKYTKNQVDLKIIFLYLIKIISIIALASKAINPPPKSLCRYEWDGGKVGQPWEMSQAPNDGFTCKNSLSYES